MDVKGQKFSIRETVHRAMAEEKKDLGQVRQTCKGFLYRDPVPGLLIGCSEQRDFPQWT